jgi:protease IV
LIVKNFTHILKKINPQALIQRILTTILNRIHENQPLDYVVFSLQGSLPMFPEGRHWLQGRLQGRAPFSLWEFEKVCERIAADPRPRGLILYLRDLSMSAAHLQTVRGLIATLRARGKRVIAYAQSYDNASYYLASACDAVWLQPGGLVATLGLRRDATFLKDALAQAGVSLDVVAISPFKSALDPLAQTDATPEFRQQVEWLIDADYQMMFDAIRAGRSGMDVQALIDAAPHIDTDALSKGYVDALLNEEDFAAALRTLDADKPAPLQLVWWEDADRILQRRWRPTHEQYIALLKVEGLIVAGESAQPPGGIPLPLPFVGGTRTGDQTFLRQVRAVQADPNVAAVVLYINSGGGSAAASEAMAAALTDLAARCPIVAYMDNAAASGGYYVATPARWIVAQGNTITGSIGVILAKWVTGGLFDKLNVRRVAFARGQNAGLLGIDQPFTDGQRAQMLAYITRGYDLFIGRVAAARRMSTQAVDAVGGGRVWTGAQALQHGLVDQIGTLSDAVAKARALANLPDYARVVQLRPSAKFIPPWNAANPAAALAYMRQGARALGNGTALFLLPLAWQEDERA